MTAPIDPKSPLGVPTHLILKVRDIGAEVRFLSAILGLAPTQENDHWAEFKLDGLAIGLQAETEFEVGRCEGEMSEVSFCVAELKAAEEFLRLLGVSFLSEPRLICSKEGVSYQYAQFRSPSGHVFSVYQLGA